MKNRTTDYKAEQYETTDHGTTKQTTTKGRAQFMSLALTVALLGGCTGTRPLKGGKALTARTPAGGVSQDLLQGENPSAPSRQAQETVKVRTYTVPAGTTFPPFQYSNIPFLASTNTPAFQYFSTPVGFTVTEREESRTKTELGAAQKDTARELGAKLSSLKGLVWVGV